LRRKRLDKVEPRKASLPAPSVALPLVYHIPGDYISSENTRILFYQKLAIAKEKKEVDNIADELRDRFGTLPQSVENLLYMVKIKQLAAESGVESISTKDRQIILQFYVSRELDLSCLSKKQSNGVMSGTKQIVLDIKQLGDGCWQEVLDKILVAIASSNQS